ITLTTAAASGSTFTLTFGNFAGQTTAAIPFDATPEMVRAALDQVLFNAYGMNTGNVFVTGSPGTYVVTFTAKLRAADIPQLTTGTAGVTIQTLRQGVGNEVQTVTLGGTSGGTFNFLYNNVAAPVPMLFRTAAPIFPSAQQVQSLLESIPNF